MSISLLFLLLYNIYDKTLIEITEFLYNVSGGTPLFKKECHSKIYRFTLR